jgi:hypothetical protein
VQSNVYVFVFGRNPSNVLFHSRPILCYSHRDPSLQLLNNLVSTWAMAQAAASLPAATLSSLVGPPAVPLPGTIPPQLSSTQAAQVAAVDLQKQLKSVYEDQRKEEEQRQLRAAFEEQQKKAQETVSTNKKKATNPKKSSAVDEKKDTGPGPSRLTTGSGLDSDDIAISPAEQLQKSYEAHLQSLKTKNGETIRGKQVDHDSKTPGEKKILNGTDKPMDDAEAGTVLLGFLNSLRQSYEDAVEKKASDESRPPSRNRKSKAKKLTSTDSEKSSGSVRRPPEVDMTPDDTRANRQVQQKYSKTISSSSDEDRDRNLSSAVSQFMSSNAGRKRPASITDVSSGNSSSQPTEFLSSLEDSSDKTEPSDDSSDKTDQSSSEEEKDEKDEEPKSRSSRSPPRKRMKGAFTQENLMVHSRRMDEGNDLMVHGRRANEGNNYN